MNLRMAAAKRDRPELGITYTEKAVLRVVYNIHQRTRAPVRTVAVSAQLGKDDRACRRFLAQLERKHLLQRVGKRGGWLPKPTTEIAGEVLRLQARIDELEAQITWLKAQRARRRMPTIDARQLALPGFDYLC